jgi:hypothetical protein
MTTTPNSITPMADEKYKQFRNYMCNELGITRQDIEAWTKQSVANEVEKKLGQINIGKLVEAAINNQAHQVLNGGYYGSGDQLRNAVAKQLAEKITIATK